MRCRWVVLAVIPALVACASAPPPPPAPAAAEPADAAPPEEPKVTTTVDTPERSRAPSTASYDEALSTPEPVDVEDDRTQLSNAQLTSPMIGVLDGCRVPKNAAVTIETAVQNGRATGVTVNVRFEKASPGKSSKRQIAAAAKAEAKAIAKITKCVDQKVRVIVWPPSRRRDSFTWTSDA